jgi:hypothetical protein
MLELELKNGTFEGQSVNANYFALKNEVRNTFIKITCTPPSMFSKEKITSMACEYINKSIKTCKVETHNASTYSSTIEDEKGTLIDAFNVQVYW